jgi:hypothetical protein
MRLWGVSMVRNEEDIVEAFVRHNLTRLDGLVVVDHGSTDRTLEILDALRTEQLPIVVLKSETVGYLQAEITTQASRDAFARADADAVFPIDADEFLRIPSRPVLERALAALPPGHYGQIAWPTFVPPLDGRPRGILETLRVSRRAAAKRASEGHAPHPKSRKVVLTRRFAQEPAAMLVMGNHYVILDRGPRATGVPHVLLPASVVELCHVPVRSVAQFVVKIATQHLARVAAHRHFQPGSVRQRAIDALKRGEPMTTEHLFGAHAVAPGSPDVALASAPTVDNGDEPPFLADIALRYTPAGRDDPLPVVTAAVERLVRRIRRGRDGGQPAPPGPAIAVAGRP